LSFNDIIIDDMKVLLHLLIAPTLGLFSAGGQVTPFSFFITSGHINSSTFGKVPFKGEMVMRFAQQVALVTGAASGIGRALVQRLAAEGAAVVAVDIVEAPLQQFVSELLAQGAKATGCVADVSSDSDVERMLATATSTYGRLDILCNNAGIMDMITPAAEVPLALWERVLSINLNGPFLACRRAIPIMLEQGGGSIVNTASEAGLRGGTAGTPYTVSKHGVVGLTRSIAFFYGDRGIRCNAVCPGGVATAIGLGGAAPNETGLAKVMPFVQATSTYVAQPEELAAAIAFLASKDASNINGAILPVDHGWSAA
jgi:NAD(P)-dependent dehydrogenase (short-subunit alcohol dehydrogenase family)